MYRKQRPKTLENWPNTSSCPALLETSVSTEVICSVMNGPYNCLPMAKAGAAQLWPSATPASATCTLQRKSHLCVAFLGIARTKSQFPHSCFWEHIIWDYINSLQTLECGNWDCGRAIPFLKIFVSNFRCLQCILLNINENHTFPPGPFLYYPWLHRGFFKKPS